MASEVDQCLFEILDHSLVELIHKGYLEFGVFRCNYTINEVVDRDVMNSYEARRRARECQPRRPSLLASM